MAQSKNEGARGYMDMNTPIDQRHLLNVSLATRKETVESCLEVSRGELKGYVLRFGALDSKEIKKRAKGWPVTAEEKHYKKWHKELKEYRKLKVQLDGINAELEKKTGENYHTMFVLMAKTELPKDDFYRVHNRATASLNELHATVE